MTPNEQKAFEKYARGIIAKYQRKLLLDRHDIALEASTKTKYMECQFREPYLNTVIWYNPDSVGKDWSKKIFSDLKRSLIHELCHVMTDPFYNHTTKRFVDKETLEEARETLTDHIAMIVFKSRI